jgi:hypothetical protein
MLRSSAAVRAKPILWPMIALDEPEVVTIEDDAKDSGRSVPSAAVY